jgi:hypothetical protein
MLGAVTAEVARRGEVHPVSYLREREPFIIEIFFQDGYRVAIDEAMKCKETGEEKTIVFGLTGTGYFDMVAYEKYHEGLMDDYIPTDEDLAVYRAKLPKI